ncbi:DNA annealing helicase and endonuclease ZRANB3 isoform X2 [Neltuma alba]|uniref:DNA annealing helicase and endonuclease ZRANB3 isoform X2 n=1 Tax=Neltuma alba TaxID=207710 RepID=UPI0010A57751|nr:DNA annealing helicase and endonuclease ZRANB3 isoform X2 [Prosopis alba]
MKKETSRDVYQSRVIRRPKNLKLARQTRVLTLYPVRSFPRDAMVLTEEQRKQAEANRLAAIERRKAVLEARGEKDPWQLFKCRKISSESIAKPPPIGQLPRQPHSVPVEPVSAGPLPRKFLVRLEICSPDSFSATPLPLRSSPYPGEEWCLQRLSDHLSHVMPSHYTQNHDGRNSCVYNLRDYHAVLKYLKIVKDIEVEEIPRGTLKVVEAFSHFSGTDRWIPCRPEHLSDDKVDELIGKLPTGLLDALLPFQRDGLRFGLRRGGRCLIADEMGLGKTLQAIAIAGCFLNEGSILVVCPAVLRFTWAEELERWLPFCTPADIHLVFGHRDNPAYLTRCPRIVVISYTMLHRLRKSMLGREWALLIVDESHHVRCTRKTSEPGEIKAVLDVASKVNRIILLSGTPSLSRPYDIFHQINMLWPGLLGKDKYAFAKTYCDCKYIKGTHGKIYADFSKGIRLEELNVLLKQTVMIRRLKEHVLLQLPPKRRQIIRLLLKRSDLVAAKTAVGKLTGNTSKSDTVDMTLDSSDEHDGMLTRSNVVASETAVGLSNIDASESVDEDVTLETLDESEGKLSYQELGIAKLSGFREWLSLHSVVAETESASKMIIFAHHHKVLDGLQEFVCEKGISFVRIDGSTLARDRQSAVVSFRSKPEVKIAIIGILAAGFGLDFSTAQDVVFLELPQCPTLMLQAEDRAHRRGQTNAVNVYIFCAKDTWDESHWKNLNKSLYRISSTTDGKYDGMKEIQVEGVSYLDTFFKTNRIHEEQAAPGEASEQATNLLDISLVSNLLPSQADSKESEAKLGDQADQQTCFADKVSFPESGEASTLDVDLVVGVFDTNKKCSGFDMSKLDETYGSKGQMIEFIPKNSGEDDNQVEEIQNKRTSTIKADDSQPVHPIEAEESSSPHMESLRFEVSPYTGRIHLYTCVLGADTRPKPLCKNFRPEELELLSSLSDGDKKKKEISMGDSLAFTTALLGFLNEWKKLRPIERKKLLGKPLQLPLAVELCYLSETSSHNNKGLLNGGSKRRMTPLMEISHPLPSDAVWRKVCLRRGNGKKEKEYTQGWTQTDEPLCKLCQKTCMGNNAMSPEYFEDLFCNLVCYEEYRMRTSNKFLRQELFEVERGVCSNCHLDCHKLVEHIRPLPLARRREYIEKVAPNVAKRKNMLEKLVNDPTEGNAWHADHIVPVYQGGGECRLENMRTLCVACHYDVTTAQCTERRKERAKAKKQLKLVMGELKAGQTKVATGSDIKEQGLLEVQEDRSEDELIVKVPGSAYSIANG